MRNGEIMTERVEEARIYRRDSRLGSGVKDERRDGD